MVFRELVDTDSSSSLADEEEQVGCCNRGWKGYCRMDWAMGHVRVCAELDVDSPAGAFVYNAT